MEKQANWYQDPVSSYHIGDKIWLYLKNVCTDWPSKKLDWKNVKYTITELISTHAV